MSIFDNIPSEKPLDELKSFQSEFLKDRNEELANLKEAVESQDFESIKKIAHNWKGFSEPYGFHGLATLSRSIENSAKAQNSEECESYLKDIEKYLELKASHIS